MTIDTKTLQSPGWWLDYLSGKLRDRNQDPLKDLFRRYEGEAEYPQSLKAAPPQARAFFVASRTSFAEMVVKSVKYPLKIQSVLTAADRGDVGDETAWRAFERSGMSDEIDDVHRLSILAGNSYAIVQRYGDEVYYTSEDPREVITEHDPIVQSKVRAAAKFYRDRIAAEDRAILWLPGRTFYARRVKRYDGSDYTFFTTAWEWDPERGGASGEERTPVPGAEDIPVFRYRNEEGISEFLRHRGLLDRLDHMILQGMTIATYQAFKQRAIKADPEDLPLEDEDGKPINDDEIFEADPGAMWRLPYTADIWESGAVDLRPLWDGIDKFIQQLAAVTFTPLAVFSPEGQNQSAAGATFAREGRTFKLEDRQSRFGRVHAKALSTIFALEGDSERAAAEGIEIVWKPAERESLNDRTTALNASTAMPWQSRMEKIMGFSPREVQRMKAQRTDDQLEAALEDETLVSGVPGETTLQAAPDSVEDAKALRDKFDALGVAIRSGVEPNNAAQLIGLEGVEFTGAIPSMLRMPERDASEYEDS